MPVSLDGFPKETQLLDQLVEKTLQSGTIVEVYLIKTPRQYESALFVGGNYKPGPPLPRPLEQSTETSAYWMGVRPRVGLSKEEGEEVLGAVNVQNRMHHINFIDKWGVTD